MASQITNVMRSSIRRAPRRGPFSGLTNRPSKIHAEQKRVQADTRHTFWKAGDGRLLAAASIATFTLVNGVRSLKNLMLDKPDKDPFF
eukprot:CAMPEP_0183340948 /NCGR_PEP_ID=MMETSP0164_2-20130417/7329_1 /TAXON_ID=221442 /ORGANISM="Coccolithus pelagicus ssp braarudi, Strain PLY182g" /LENGTH=87 /DNA_ID=CAMNT_0025511163 /DNA_START=23 /DNA_END=286 /DNA_ORIENTATION=+